MPSRQYLWQMRRKEEGRCVICGQTAIVKNRCMKHAVSQREYQRRYRGSKGRYNSLTYRMELLSDRKTN